MKDFVNATFNCGYCKQRFNKQLKLDEDSGLPKKGQNVICPGCKNWLELRSFED